METFWHDGDYDAALDHRDYTGTLARMRNLPRASLWMLLGSRRGRKTWTLRGLKRCLGEAAFYADLRDTPLPRVRTAAKSATYLLLDVWRPRNASAERSSKVRW